MGFWFILVLETRFEGPHTPDNFRLMESLSLFFSMNDMASLKALCEGQRVRVQQEVSSRAQLPGQGTLAVLFTQKSGSWAIDILLCSTAEKKDKSRDQD